MSPSVRTDGGHRRYSDQDVQRLSAVALLRMAGQSTDQIGRCLAGSEWNLSNIMESQVAQLEEQLTALGTLRHRLAEVARSDSNSGSTYLAEAQRALSTPYSARKAVALLPYLDVVEAQRWLGEVFRLAPGPPGHGPDGAMRYASVITGQGLVHLHQAVEGFQPPAVSGVCTAMIVVSVDDVDQLADHIARHGGRITHGPTDMTYGVRELGAADLAGHVWCFHETLQTSGEQT